MFQACLLFLFKRDNPKNKRAEKFTRKVTPAPVMLSKMARESSCSLSGRKTRDITCSSIKSPFSNMPSTLQSQNVSGELCTFGQTFTHNIDQKAFFNKVLVNLTMIQEDALSVEPKMSTPSFKLKKRKNRESFDEATRNSQTAMSKLGKASKVYQEHRRKVTFAPSLKNNGNSEKSILNAPPNLQTQDMPEQEIDKEVIKQQILCRIRETFSKDRKSSKSLKSSCKMAPTQSALYKASIPKKLTMNKSKFQNPAPLILIHTN